MGHEAIMNAMNKGRFSRFEEQIQRLVEGSFARLFAGRLHPREVATRLMRAMEDNTQTDPDGTLIAPNSFTIELNPEDYDAVLVTQPDIVQLLSDTVVDLANRTEARLMTMPEVNLTSSPNVLPRMI